MGACGCTNTFGNQNLGQNQKGQKGQRTQNRKSQLIYFKLAKDQKKKIKSIKINLRNKTKQQSNINAESKVTMIGQIQNQQDSTIKIDLEVKTFYQLSIKEKQDPQIRYNLILQLTGKLIENINQIDKIKPIAQIVINTDSVNLQTLNNFLDLFIQAIICCDAEMEKNKRNKNHKIIIFPSPQIIKELNLDAGSIQQKVQRELLKAIL